MGTAFNVDAELVMVFRALVAVLLGALIGWERRPRDRIDSEIRTFAGVSLGACTFGLISVHSAGGTFDPTHVSAQVVTGIGFLGAGIILKDNGRVRGLATAATLWATASVGLALAHGLYGVALVNTTVIFLVRHFPGWRRLGAGVEAEPAAVVAQVAAVPPADGRGGG